MTNEFSEEKDESLGQSVPDEVQENESQIGPAEEGEVEESTDSLTKCTEELANEKDLRLRVAAEFANYRRRMENQRRNWSSRAQAGVIRTFLPILDDFERSLDAAEQTGSGDNAFKSLKSGVNLVYENFLGELEKLGLTRIKSVGEVFDEQLHEAVGQAPVVEGGKDGHVLHESQAGYCLEDQVLRHAKVIVAVAPTFSDTDEPEEVS
ncbi:MAG: nucleotide exchange factor GrpE [Bacteroidetes bacterium]|nr:nucleotide exchange factor GrpE [Bacteroidota bacterium]